MKVSAKDYVNISKHGFCEGDFRVDSQTAAASAATVSLLFIIFIKAIRLARRRHGLCLLAMFLSGIISSKEDYMFEHVYLDMATLVTLDLDHCTVRYKPSVKYPQPDRNHTKPKVLVTLVKDKLITLDMDVCSNHVTLTVVNTRQHADKFQDTPNFGLRFCPNQLPSF